MTRPAAPAAPRVAIVVLQWRRADETAACLRSLEAIDYPNYRLVVVDNHSGDDSVERLRREFAHVAILENQENLGFAGGCNVGIETALADAAVRYVLLGWETVTRERERLLEQLVTAKRRARS